MSDSSDSKGSSRAVRRSLNKSGVDNRREDEEELSASSSSAKQGIYHPHIPVPVATEDGLATAGDANFRPSVTEVKLYSPRSYNQAHTEFLRTRLADFEARGLIEKAGPEISQTSPVLIVRNAGKGPWFVVDFRSLSEYIEMQCRASIALRDQMRFIKYGLWQISYGPRRGLLSGPTPTTGPAHLRVFDPFRYFRDHQDDNGGSQRPRQIP
jgi:hypothetical protein